MAEKKDKIHKRLTIAELKNCKGFENYSDEHAEETIKSLEKLSILFYELYMKQKRTEERLSIIKKDAAEEKIESENKDLENNKGGINERTADDKERDAA